MQVILTDEVRENVKNMVLDTLAERYGYTEKADALEDFEGMLTALKIFDHDLIHFFNEKWKELNSRYESGVGSE